MAGVRPLVLPVLWALAGVALVLQVLLVWTARGSLSSTSPVDVVALVRAGTLTSVSTLAAYALLVLPVLGAALLVAAPARLPVVRRGRAVVGALAVVVAVVLLGDLADLDPGRFGAGAWVTVLGASVALVAVVVEVVSWRGKEVS